MNSETQVETAASQIPNLERKHFNRVKIFAVLLTIIGIGLFSYFVYSVGIGEIIDRHRKNWFRRFRTDSVYLFPANLLPRFRLAFVGLRTLQTEVFRRAFRRDDRRSVKQHHSARHHHQRNFKSRRRQKSSSAGCRIFFDCH